MTRFLLDTNAALRLLVAPQGLALAPLEAPDAVLFCSPVVPWEIAIKTRRGQLNAELLLDDWPTAMETIGAQALEITAEDAIRAGTLDWGHRDPFDRMIVAQAQLRGLTVVTSDGTILNSGLVPSLEL